MSGIHLIGPEAAARCVIHTLGGPTDGHAVMTVARRMVHALSLCREVQAPELESGWPDTCAKLIDACRVLDSLHQPAGPEYIGWDDAPPNLFGIYTEHPVYSCCYVRAADPALETNFGALMASMLPVLVALQASAISTPSLFPLRERTARAVRKLSNPAGEVINIIGSLPYHALGPSALKHHILDQSALRGISLSDTEGSERHLCQLVNSIDWYCTRTLRLRPHAHGGGHQHDRAASDPMMRSTVSVNLGGDEPVQVQKYFPPTAKEEKTWSRHLLPGDPPPGPASTTIVVDSRWLQYDLANRQRLARKNGQFLADAIDMANQNLPISPAGTTPHEVDILLQALDNLEDPGWSGVPAEKRAEVAGLVGGILYLGREHEDVALARTAKASNTAIRWEADTSTLYLPVLSPEHKAPIGDARAHVLTILPCLTLRPTHRLRRLLEHIHPARSRLFCAGIADDALNLLNVLNAEHRINLTFSKLASYLPDRIARLAPVDEVVAHYFAGQPPGNHLPSVYAAIDSVRIQRLYDEAVNELEQEGDSSHTGNQCGIAGLSFVGAKQVPTLAAIRQIFSRLKDALAQASKPVRTHSPEDWSKIPARLHNIMTCFIIFLLIIATGARPLTRLLPAWFFVDGATGMIFISEKDLDQYQQARWIPVPSFLLQLLKIYQQHVLRFRAVLAKFDNDGLLQLDAQCAIPPLSSGATLSRETDRALMEQSALPLFRVDEATYRIGQVSPAFLQHVVGNDIIERVGATRSFFRTRMGQAGLSGEVINAALGHWESGQEPWGRFSTLSPRLWRKQIRQFADTLLDELDVTLPECLAALEYS